mgnify:FL=1
MHDGIGMIDMSNGEIGVHGDSVSLNVNSDSGFLHLNGVSLINEGKNKLFLKINGSYYSIIIEPVV